MITPTMGRVYLDHPRSERMRTSPGRSLNILGGVATIYDARDMIHCLRRSDAIIEVEGEWIDFLPEWLRACDETHPARALLHLPDGRKMRASEYVLATSKPAPGKAVTRS